MSKNKRPAICTVGSFFILSFSFSDFVRVVVRASLVGTAFGDGFRSLHHKRSADCPAAFFILADISGRFRFYRVFAFRIIGTAVKQAESAAPFCHHSVFADGASDAGGVLLFKFGVFLYVFAFLIIVAGNKSAEFAVALNKLAFLAVGAYFSRFFWSL